MCSTIQGTLKRTREEEKKDPCDRVGLFFLPPCQRSIPGDSPAARREKRTPNRRTTPAHTNSGKGIGAKGEGELFLRTLKQTCSQDCPRAPLAFKNSMIHMFCNSHYVSHFAAFFIDVGAKISSVTSFTWFFGGAVAFLRTERAATSSFGFGCFDKGFK